MNITGPMLSYDILKSDRFILLKHWNSTREILFLGGAAFVKHLEILGGFSHSNEECLALSYCLSILEYSYDNMLTSKA